MYFIHIQNTYNLYIYRMYNPHIFLSSIQHVFHPYIIHTQSPCFKQPCARCASRHSSPWEQSTANFGRNWHRRSLRRTASHYFFSINSWALDMNNGEIVEITYTYNQNYDYICYSNMNLMKFIVWLMLTPLRNTVSTSDRNHLQ